MSRLALPIALPGTLAVALAAALAAAPVARADVRPVLLPARDAALSYRVTDAKDGHSMTVRAYVKGGARLLRVDPEGMPGYAIVDRTAGLLTIVMPGAHGYLLMPIGSAAARFVTQAGGLRFRRIGHQTVAGLPCTEWSVTDPRATGPERGHGDACITADGLLLRLRGSSDGGGVRGSVVATAVTEAPQPASLFAVPAGYAKLGRLPGARS